MECKKKKTKAKQKKKQTQKLTEAECRSFGCQGQGWGQWGDSGRSIQTCIDEKLVLSILHRAW